MGRAVGETVGDTKPTSTLKLGEHDDYLSVAEGAGGD